VRIRHCVVIAPGADTHIAKGKITDAVIRDYLATAVSAPAFHRTSPSRFLTDKAVPNRY
jgi:hypothetical protein